MDQPCRACPRRGGQTAWQLIGCQRGRLEMQIKICLSGSSHCPIPFHELQMSITNCLATATRQCNLQTQDLREDPNCSSVTPNLRLDERVSGPIIVGVSHRRALFTVNEVSKHEACSGCTQCLQFLRFPSNTHQQYDFRRCSIRLLWELTDNPSTIPQLKIGSISQIRELLKAACRYAAEIGDVVRGHSCTETLDRG